MTFRPIPWWVAVLATLLLHGALALGYAVHTPAFEAPDENGHYYYATFVAQRGEQPKVLGWHRQAGGSPFDEADLGHHPPLYYALLAVALDALDLTDSLPSPRPSGVSTGALHWQHGFDEQVGPSFEVKGLFRLRMISVLLGALSILFVMSTARALWPGCDARAIFAGVILACLPQWSHAHASLDNGNLATTLASGVTYVLALALRRGSLRVRDGILVGAVFAAALWTKANALALGPPIVAVVLLLGRVGGEWRRQSLVAGALALGLAGAAYAPLVWRNLSLYGDPLGQAAHAAAFASSRLPPGELWNWLSHGFPHGLFRSTIGMFGWWRLGVPSEVLIAALGLFALAVVGLFWKRTPAHTPTVRGRWVLLCTLFLATFAIVLRYNLTFAQPQGRYLFPAAATIAITLAIGWTNLLRRLPRPRLSSALAVTILVGGAIGTLMLVVRPGFAMPAPSSGAHEAILFGALTRDGASESADIELLEPADGAILAEPPTFRFRVPSASPPKSLRIWRDDGRLLGATFEMLRMDLTGGSFTLPTELWEAVAPGSSLRWHIADVSDRSIGADPRHGATTKSRSVVRSR